MPKPERDLAKLETSVVAEALAVLRETTEQEIGRAVRAVHVHVPLEILRRQVCRNCGWPVPCATRRLAERVTAPGTASTHVGGSRALPSEGDDILLDLQVGDIRCVLMRRPVTLPRSEVSLSPREQEIARMVARGYPNKTIAAVLDISAWTVGTHLRRIFAKVGVTSRAAMVARLLDEGGRQA